jgi:hypothetical protein
VKSAEVVEKKGVMIFEECERAHESVEVVEEKGVKCARGAKNGRKLRVGVVKRKGSAENGDTEKDLSLRDESQMQG